MTQAPACLWAFVTGDNHINLLALDHLQQHHPDAGGIHVRLLATKGMLDNGNAENLRTTMQTSGRPGSVEVVKLLTVGPPPSWGQAIEAAFDDHAPEAGTHVWAYGGGTKPMGIGMWLAHEALRSRSPEGVTHTTWYPEANRGVCLVDGEEKELYANLGLAWIAGLRGATATQAAVLERNVRTGAADSIGFAVQAAGAQLADAKRALASGDAWKAFLRRLATGGPPLASRDPDTAFEWLVTARTAAFLSGQDTVPLVAQLAKLYGSTKLEAETGAVAEFDTAWTTRTGRLFAIDAKNKNPSTDAKKALLRKDFERQRANFREVSGRYGHFAYCLPLLDGASQFANQDGEQRSKLRILHFDSGDLFEQQLMTWLERPHPN